MVSNNSTFIGSSSTTMIRAALIASEGSGMAALKSRFCAVWRPIRQLGGKKKGLLRTVVAGVSPARPMGAADTAATIESQCVAAGGASTASIAKLPLDEFDF